jgi:hypothetical protein
MIARPNTDDTRTQRDGCAVIDTRGRRQMRLFDLEAVIPDSGVAGNSTWA